MREEDKPFICYKQGWNIKIFPRNSSGWKSLRLWMLAVLSPVIIFVPFAVHFDDTPHEPAIIWAVLPLLLLVAGIIFAMIRWMLARSEIINIGGLPALKRDQERKHRSRRS